MQNGGDSRIRTLEQAKHLFFQQTVVLKGSEGIVPPPSLNECNSVNNARNHVISTGPDSPTNAKYGKIIEIFTFQNLEF